VTADRPIEPAADPPVVLLSLAATEPGTEPASRPTGWSDLALRLRRPLPTGPDAWRNSRWQ
jgi:hypothetical protein